MSGMDKEDPWKWMQPYDVRRFGDVILDPKEQERWCRAVLLGGLPFMWRKAEVARNVIYDRLELREGDRVLVIGECIEPCGFVDDAKQVEQRRRRVVLEVGHAVLDDRSRRQPAQHQIHSRPLRRTVGCHERDGDAGQGKSRWNLIQRLFSDEIGRLTKATGEPAVAGPHVGRSQFGSDADHRLTPQAFDRNGVHPGEVIGRCHDHDHLETSNGSDHNVAEILGVHRHERKVDLVRHHTLRVQL